MAEQVRPPVLIRGTGDVGSAVAVLLFRRGYPVMLHDDAAPVAPRRGMAFTDAVFDGGATLDGVSAQRFDRPADLSEAMIAGHVIPVTVLPFTEVLRVSNWFALVDARLRKRSIPDRQRGMAPLTIGLGPNFIAGELVDIAIETAWGERLGDFVSTGATLPLAGEPRSLGGVGRARFIYAPVAGRFETMARIGESIAAGQIVGRIGSVELSAPLSGVIRGLTRSGVSVAQNTKIIEVDPRGDPSNAFGIGERPRRIAEGVCRAIGDIRSTAGATHDPGN
ncbi:xanthine dehydrogenase [Bradyrhizobium sp. AUGA SZCCT0176]|uniref:xanthine dehydrogenase n=1 Tax=Bradyrhizobium sp. AUGA SZCCT0176 TaxID=2807664 RepID=UPI001BA7EDBB|nr:xanthine dehydrogenase [Bradyrhizobium sp. AUGA SZCCT0176]MBR1225215.1 xanthine dehydrogenase [Bradyrhizobium sp. AUGA SZCCT0176]